MGSRKLYEAIAENLRHTKPPRECPNEKRVWTTCVLGVAEALKADNSRFSYARFYEACGYLER